MATATSKNLSLVIGAVVFTTLLGGFAIGFGVVAQRIASGFNGTVALGCLTVLISTSVALWQFDRTKRKEAEARIFLQRAPVYQRLINVLRDIMFAAKGWTQEKSSDALARELSEITYEMIVWGGQDTVRELIKLSDMQAGDTGTMLRSMSSLFRAVRRELGHSDDASLPDDLVLQMIVANERDQVKAQLKS